MEGCMNTVTLKFWNPVFLAFASYLNFNLIRHIPGEQNLGSCPRRHIGLSERNRLLT